MNNGKLSSFISKVNGTPFKDFGRDLSGLDCWGLIVMAYRELFGVVLQEPDVSALSAKEVELFYYEYSKMWKDVPVGQERPGDLAMFRNGRWISHAGLVIKPGLMLHVDRDLGTLVTTYYSGTWKTCSAGILRYELASYN
jgi:cell wall-associated NlpC family hydrolase